MTPEDIKKLTGIDTTPEALHPALSAWLEEDDMFGTMLKHPLVFCIIYTPEQNAMLNKAFLAKQAYLKRCEDEENWSGYVWMYERAHRLDAFMDIRESLSDEAYWTLLGHIWTDSENIFQNRDEWEEALTEDRAYRERIMDEDDQMALALLPDELKVYRGWAADEGGEDGMSWTLSAAKAKFFATRFSHRGEGYVAHGWVKKEDVIAYLTGRNEQEIVVLPEAVQVKSIHAV